MPTKKQIETLAREYLESLRAKERGLVSYEEDVGESLAQMTIDDFLLEAFEFGDDDVDDEVIHEAFLIRARQRGLVEERNRKVSSLKRIIKRAEGRPSALVRVAAALVCVAMLSGLTVGAAYAFNWQALMRILDPIAETFGIIKGDAPRMEKERNVGEVKRIDDWDLMPGDIRGHKIKLGWIPERYSFSHATMHSSNDTMTCISTFICEDDEMFLSVHLFDNVDAANELTSERDVGETETMYFMGYEITVTTNISYTVYSWIQDDAIYKLSGTLSNDEIQRVLESIF